MTACVSMLLKSRVPDMLPNLFPSWSGLGLISTPVDIAADIWELRKSYELLVGSIWT